MRRSPGVCRATRGRIASKHVLSPPAQVCLTGRPPMSATRFRDRRPESVPRGTSAIALAPQNSSAGGGRGSLPREAATPPCGLCIIIGPRVSHAPPQMGKQAATYRHVKALHEHVVVGELGPRRLARGLGLELAQLSLHRRALGARGRGGRRGGLERSLERLDALLARRRRLRLCPRMLGGRGGSGRDGTREWGGEGRDEGGEGRDEGREGREGGAGRRVGTRAGRGAGERTAAARSLRRLSRRSRMYVPCSMLRGTSTPSSSSLRSNWLHLS